MRRTTEAFLAATIVLVVASPVRADENASSKLAARYSLEGRQDGKGDFRGECTIKKSGARWEVKADLRYSSGARETREGEGTLEGQTFTVSFTVTPGSSSNGSSGAKPFRLNVRYSLKSLDVFSGAIERTNGTKVGVERLRRPGRGLVLVLANRKWEVDNLVKTLAKSSKRPKEIDGATLELIHHSNGETSDDARRPRARFRCDGYEVEVWCVEDLTRAEEDEGNVEAATKLSRVKWDSIPRAFAGEGGALAKLRRPALVIGFGSGAGTKVVPNNGSVVVGHDVFVHDPYASPKEAKDPWRKSLDRLVTGTKLDLLAGVDAVRQQVEPGFEKPPVTAGKPRLVHGDDLVSIACVNVESSKDYEWADPETIQTFASKVKSGDRVGSVDTCLGLFSLRTRSLCDAPFVYVAGILNRSGKFDELDKDPDAQTRTVMTNAAEATTWLLPTLTRNVASASGD